MKDRFATSDVKVTYILGAGASANALPTVKKTNVSNGLTDTMRELAEWLDNNQNIAPEHGIYIQDISRDLKSFADSSDKFGTVDTYAKFLYLHQKSNDLIRLKFLISFYFIIEQLFHKKLDQRPLIFFTSVLQYKNILPTNIKILNWNYDSQLQLSGNVFQQEEYQRNGNGSIHTPALFNYYPNIGYKGGFNIDDFALVHLNGVANMYYNSSENTFQSHHIENHNNDLNALINLTKGMEGRYLISFAWENAVFDKRIEIAKSIVKETDYLVIIGYSFPFFNRDIDKEIFETLKESNKLKKIYYQDPIRTGDFLREQFTIPTEVHIAHISDTQNYFVPNEL